MLKVKFWQIENAVVFKIIEQSDTIERGCGTIFEHNGFRIRSAKVPFITTSYLCILGAECDINYGNMTVSSMFNDTEEATRAIDDACAAIKAYNDSVKSTLNDTDDIYIREVIAE